MGELIAVLSGKGGTGKTSVCAGVAAALAQSGQKVLCIDCDVGLRNLDIALGISQIGGLSFLDVCSGGYDISMAARHPEYPELDDFGDANLVADNGAANYFRVDWFTPSGLGSWGDGRTVLLGTEGYIEMRKYINVATSTAGNNLYLVNKDGEKYIDCNNTVGFPFFGELILDSLNRTENAMTQEHAFKAAELCVKAQMQALTLQ